MSLKLFVEFLSQSIAGVFRSNISGGNSNDRPTFRVPILIFLNFFWGGGSVRGQKVY